jgi:hypothetical protein
MNFNKLILKETDEKLDKLRAEAEYIQDYLKEPTEHVKKLMDAEAWTFHNEFLPLYGKYAGTKKLLQCIKDYTKKHEIIRKDDFRSQLIGMWIYHIRLCCEYHGIEFKAEWCFKIRQPKAILDII